MEAPNYIISADMSAASITGADIVVGVLGILRAEISWVLTGSPVGVIALEYKNLAGLWVTHPESTTKITSQPNSNTVSLICIWTGLQAYELLRFTYTRTSGGSAASALTIRTTSK